MVIKMRPGKSPRFHVDKVGVRTQAGSSAQQDQQGHLGYSGVGDLLLVNGNDSLDVRRLVERVCSPSFSDEKGSMPSIIMKAGSDRCCCQTCSFQVVDLEVQECRSAGPPTERRAGFTEPMAGPPAQLG